mgnify:CR=1 FL=1
MCLHSVEKTIDRISSTLPPGLLLLLLTLLGKSEDIVPKLSATAHFPPQLFGFRQRHLHDEACRTLCFKFRRRDWSGSVAKHGGVPVRTMAARIAAAAPSFQAGQLCHDHEVGLWVRVKKLFLAHRRGVQRGDRLREWVGPPVVRRTESPAQARAGAPQESKRGRCHFGDRPMLWLRHSVIFRLSRVSVAITNCCGHLEESRRAFSGYPAPGPVGPVPGRAG